MLFAFCFLVFSCSEDFESELSDSTVKKKLDIGDRSYKSDPVKYKFGLGNVPSGYVIDRNNELHLQVEIANQVLYEMEDNDPYILELLNGYGNPCWECSYVPFEDQFLVNIPTFLNDEITGLFTILKNGDKLNIRFTDREANKQLLKYGSATTYLINLYFIEIEKRLNNLNNVADVRSCECPNGSEMGYLDTNENGDPVVTPPGYASAKFCVCQDLATLYLTDQLQNSCCYGNGGELLDGGFGEAGMDGGYLQGNLSTQQWLELWSAWLEYWYSTYWDNLSSSTGPRPNFGIGDNNDDNEWNNGLLENIRNEEIVLAYLAEVLDLDIGEDGSMNPLYFVLAGNPNVANPIYLYLNGFYPGVTPSIDVAIQLLELINIYSNLTPPLAFEENHLLQLLTVEPALMNDIHVFLSNHPNSQIALDVIYDFIDLQSCDLGHAGCEITDYPNNFEDIFTFYSQLTSTDLTWLQAKFNANTHGAVLDYLLVNTNHSLTEKFSNSNRLITLISTYSLNVFSAVQKFLLEETDLLGELLDFLVSGNGSLEYISIVNEVLGLLPNKNDADEIEYILWAIQNHGNDVAYYLEGLDFFKNDTPFIADQNTGITIISSYVPTEAPSTYPSIGSTPYRTGHEYDPINGILPEDMQSGFDGEANLLKTPAIADLPTTEILQGFYDLIHHPELNSDLQIVATDYYNRWVQGTGGDYFNTELSTYLLDNEHMKATVRDFGKLLNNHLTVSNGDINNIPEFDEDFTSGYRAIFNTGEKFTGMVILVNDTEKLNVFNLNDYTYDPQTKEWSGSFYFQVLDNFGLDNQDLLDFQGTKSFNAGPKFAGWWILQHMKGYKPFRTDIRNVFKISGKLK